MKGRGSKEQALNRFATTEHCPDPEYQEWLYQSGELTAPKTELSLDHSKSIISHNSSPDIDFDKSLNPYRGCEHGCSYCYARPTHEYLGFSAALDFETKIVAKLEAPLLLRKELSKKKWDCSYLVMSGVTDPYQPMEKKLQITRGCLEVLSQFRQPVEIITKNFLITRDLEFLSELARHRACRVRISITSLDPALSNILEPRASTPQQRLRAIELLAAQGVPVGVNVAPAIPGLNDHELPAILKAAASAGAQWGSYIPLRLPGNVVPVFTDWLETHKPNVKEKVLRLVKELRQGKLNQAEFHKRFVGQGEVANRLRQLFEIGRKAGGLSDRAPELSARHFEVPGPKQLGLFDQ